VVGGSLYIQFPSEAIQALGYMVVSAELMKGK
jgi:hypothetical protein